MEPLDTGAVRARFPGLDSDWAFFDNAGGTHVLDTAIERVADYLRTTPVQLGASYDASQRASARQLEAAGATARLMNAADPAEIVFGPSTTSLLDRLARAIRPTLAEGDEIVVTDVDHESNIGPWRRLEKTGIRIRTWPMNADTLRLEPEDLSPLLNERTKLVCFTHVSNILGDVMPVAGITRMVHAAGARVVVDGVACAPHRLMDVAGWDVDFYVFSAYKLFGPHLAALYGKRSHLLELENLNHYFFEPDALPAKLQPGAISYELPPAMPAVTDYLAGLGGVESDHPRERLKTGFDRIAAHEMRLASRLIEFLNARPEIEIIGPDTADPERRTATVSFTVRNRDSADFPAALDREKLAIRFGHFYAVRLIERLGLTEKNGVVRVSMAHYNTVDEVDRVVEALDRTLDESARSAG